MDAIDTDANFGMVAEVDQGVLGSDLAAAPASSLAGLVYSCLGLSTHSASHLLAARVGTWPLRLPSPAPGDVDAVRGYSEREQLDGGWLPRIPLVPAEQAIGDWLDGWAGRPGRDGPVLVLTTPMIRGSSASSGWGTVVRGSLR